MKRKSKANANLDQEEEKKEEVNTSEQGSSEVCDDVTKKKRKRESDEEDNNDDDFKKRVKIEEISDNTNPFLPLSVKIENSSDIFSSTNVSNKNFCDKAPLFTNPFIDLSSNTNLNQFNPFVTNSSFTPLESTKETKDSFDSSFNPFSNVNPSTGDNLFATTKKQEDRKSVV